MTPSRRLAAILVADVVGYSRLMETDEAGTLAALKERRKTILEPVVKEHGGRVVKLMGDGVLVEFASAVKAVEAALKLQVRFAAANDGMNEDRRILLRIGINLGDVIGEGSDIYGDGVNIAARLEALAEPGGICISAKVMDEIAGKVTAYFESMGERKLKNIAKPVHAYRSGERQQPPLQTQRGSRASIAVLPFDNLSGDPALQYISDGFTEDITTELARFSGLSVAARHAAFHYAGKGRNLAEVARELDVNFVLEGSVRIASGRARITAQLVDARTGSHVWADRYDRDSKDIFAIQDQVVASIVAMLEERLVATEAAKVRAKPATSWSAYECLLHGRDLCNRFREPEAVPLFERALAIDPEFAAAHSWLAVALTLTLVYAIDASRQAEADAASKRALQLDGNNATCQWARAMVLFLSGDLEGAKPHFERAMALNPADIQIKGDYANWMRIAGRPEEALALIDQELAKGPYVPDWFAAIRGHILFDLKQYASARKVLDSIPIHYASGQLSLIAACAYVGDMAGAASAVARLQEMRPGLTLRDVAHFFAGYADKSATAHFIEGLRMAGLPE